MNHRPAGERAFDRARPRPSSSRLRVSTPTIVLLPLSTFLQAAALVASSVCKPAQQKFKHRQTAQPVAKRPCSPNDSYAHFQGHPARRPPPHQDIRGCAPCQAISLSGRQCFTASSSF